MDENHLTFDKECQRLEQTHASIDMNDKIVKLARLRARRSHLEIKLQILEEKIGDLMFPDIRNKIDISGIGVYILRCCTTFKIGYATNLSDRLTSLQIGNPYDLIVVSFIKCQSTNEAERLESYLHNRFCSKYRRGEWYSLTESDLQWIIDLELVRSYERLFELNSNEPAHIKPISKRSADVGAMIKSIISTMQEPLPNHTYVETNSVIIKAETIGIPQNVALASIEKLKHDGDIFEPRPGYIKLF